MFVLVFMALSFLRFSRPGCQRDYTEAPWASDHFAATFPPALPSGLCLPAFKFVLVFICLSPFRTFSGQLGCQLLVCRPAGSVRFGKPLGCLEIAARGQPQ